MNKKIFFYFLSYSLSQKKKGKQNVSLPLLPSRRPYAPQFLGISICTIMEDWALYPVPPIRTSLPL